MARPLRMTFAGAVYHVYSRGNERRNIFCAPGDKQTFLEYLSRTKIKYGLKVFAYVLMDNHYHLLLETRLPNLSQAMQHLITGYTKHFNRRAGRSGHLFESRFKSLIVEKESYLLELTRYIHLNPARARIAQTIQALKQFQCSSLSDYTEPWAGNICGLINVDEVLACFAGEKERARSFYEAFVRDGMENAVQGASPMSQAAASCILGSNAFVKRLKESVDENKIPSDVSYRKELMSPRSTEEILHAVMKHYAKACRAPEARGERNMPRKVAMVLMKHYAPVTLREISRMFHVCPSAVCQMAKRVENNSALYKEVEKVKTLLFV